MKIDPAIQAAGSRCGIDAEALYQKYVRGAPKRSPGSDSAAPRVVAAAAARGEPTNTDGLDRFLICKACRGYGLVKEFYNHQVKEVNCEECDGEGVVERPPRGP